MATETEWDGGATLWDVDIPSPGDRTFWDLLPDTIKIDQLAKIIPAKWLAKVIRE